VREGEVEPAFGRYLDATVGSYARRSLLDTFQALISWLARLLGAAGPAKRWGRKPVQLQHKLSEARIAEAMWDLVARLRHDAEHDWKVAAEIARVLGALRSPL
jgi:hypothetical protein